VLTTIILIKAAVVGQPEDEIDRGVIIWQCAQSVKFQE
jgi:hypothetical protein